MQQTLFDWTAIPGTLQKVASFVGNLNMTGISQTAMATAGRLAQNMIVKQISSALPVNITQTVSDYMIAIGSGGLNTTIQEMLTTVCTLWILLCL